MQLTLDTQRVRQLLQLLKENNGHNCNCDVTKDSTGDWDHPLQRQLLRSFGGTPSPRVTSFETCNVRQTSHHATRQLMPAIIDPPVTARGWRHFIYHTTEWPLPYLPPLPCQLTSLTLCQRPTTMADNASSSVNPFCKWISNFWHLNSNTNN